MERRPGSRLWEVDLSRLGPPKSSQVGFICRRRQFPRAQSVLGQVDFFLKFVSNILRINALPNAMTYLTTYFNFELYLDGSFCLSYKNIGLINYSRLTLVIISTDHYDSLSLQ